MSDKVVLKVVTQPTFQRGTAVRKPLTLAEALLDRVQTSLSRSANTVEYFQLDGVTPFEFPGVAAKPAKKEPKAAKKEPLKVTGPVTEPEEKEKKEKGV